MDPLSEVLTLLKLRSHHSGRFDLGLRQALRFGPHQGVKCYAVIGGSCWLSVSGEATPIPIREGDCFLLPKGKAFCLSTDLSVEPTNFEVLLAALRSGASQIFEGESGCTLAGSHFLLGGEPADLLLASLPTVVHLRSETAKAAMLWSLERMREELRDPQIGGTFVVQQLAQMMLVQALRVHLAEQSSREVGWLYAMSDPQMKAAIAAMHAEPAHGWTVSELAMTAGMSRSIFAMRFKALVGTSPVEYLTRWRMLLAADRLTSSNGSASSCASIAWSLGYTSESAFGKAFKRVTGYSPRHYSRAERNQAGLVRGRVAPLSTQTRDDALPQADRTLAGAKAD